MQNPHTQSSIEPQLSRRSFIAGTAAGLAAAASLAPIPAISQETKKPPLVIFTKHLGWMGYNELADTIAELGFDGADLTLRGGGHVLPQNVEDDLPKVVEAVRKAGKEVNMFTSGITDPDDKQTEVILKTASALKIPYYRIGTWRYEKDREILPQLREWNAKLKVLADMNKQYNICAGYHNHSGEGDIGGPVWDVVEMLRDVDPKWVGSNFDMGHVVAEGISGAWVTNFHIIKDRIRGTAMKDVIWHQKGNRWGHSFPPIGEGIVDWNRYFKMLKAINFTGPMSMHFEYDVEGGSKEEEQKNWIAAIKRDVSTFKELLNESGLW